MLLLPENICVHLQRRKKCTYIPLSSSTPALFQNQNKVKMKGINPRNSIFFPANTHQTSAKGTKQQEKKTGGPKVIKIHFFAKAVEIKINPNSNINFSFKN